HHVVVSRGEFFAGELIAFTTGLLITVVLLVLTLRAAKIPGTPRAIILFAVCGILWSAGGPANVSFLAAGMRARWARGLQYAGLAASPIPILALWRPFADRKIRYLQITAILGAVVLAILLYWPPAAEARALGITASYATLMLLAGSLTL